MKTKGVVLASLLLLAPAAAMASESVNAPTLTGETGLFSLYTGDTLPQGQWSFSLYGSNWDRLTKDQFLRPGNEVDHIGIDWTRYSASVGYGLTDRWEISFMVPFDDFNRAVPLSDEQGMGNVRIGTKFRLFGAEGDDSRLALNVFGEPKTADSKLRDAGLAGKGGFGAGLDWSYQNFTANVGYHDPGKVLPKEAIAGFGYAGSVSDHLDWITELVGTFYNDGDVKLKDAVDLTTGGRLWFGDDRWALNFALRADLGQLSNFDKRCPLGGVFGLTYMPRFGAHAKAAPMSEPAPAPAPPPPPPAPEPTPAPVAAPPAPEPAPAPAPAPEQRETINFTANSARLSNIAKAKLDEVALKMKQDPSLTAEVLGYSDNKGAESANMRLSQQRADAVKTYLMKRHGIDGSRITASGKGSADPLGDNATAAGRAENRRAVIILRLQ